MIVNYVYLFLILLIICFIIYIIYLSYDYNFNDTKEHFFVDLSVENISAINLNTNEINDDLAKFNDNYNKLDIDIHNRNVQKEQKKNLDLLQKTKTNLSVSDKLKIMNKNLKPEKKTFPINERKTNVKSRSCSNTPWRDHHRDHRSHRHLPCRSDSSPSTKVQALPCPETEAPTRMLR